MDGDRADQLLRRAQQLRDQLKADVKNPGTSASLPSKVTPVEPAPTRNELSIDPTMQLSNRAAAELELILAEDPMWIGRRHVNGSVSDVNENPRDENLNEARKVGAPPAPPVQQALEVPKHVAPTSKLQDFDGLHLKLESLELTALGKRKLKGVESIWLRCRIALGDSNPEEILIRCPESNGNGVALQHSSHQQKLESAAWREVAAKPLQLGLLVGSAEKTKARAPRSKGGSQALSPIAEAELLWFAALLEPGKVCPLIADLKAIEPTGSHNSLGRLHFSMELTESHQASADEAEAEDASGIYLRVWLDTLEIDSMESARVILKLGPTQEVAVPVVQREGVGRLCHCAISLSPVWKVKTGICVSGPSPSCIFVQIWQGPELCGLAKLVLSELNVEALQNIDLQGYEKILEDAVDVLAVTSERSLGKLRLLVHAGLEPMLQALPPKSLEAEKVDAAAEMMSLCCQNLDILEKTIIDLPFQSSRGEGGENTTEQTLQRELMAMLQACQPSLTEEVDGSTWNILKSRIQAVHQSFDQLIKEVGDECTSVALDFLDVAAPSMLQREDIARVLKFRGIELGWNTLERIFTALGCAKRSDVLPASNFTRLFRCRAERRMIDVAGLRRLEAKVLAWWRWREDPPITTNIKGNQNQKKEPTEVSTSRKSHQKMEALDLVSAYSKSDNTIDLMGLKVLLASMQGPFQQDEVEGLAQWLFEGYGVRPGAGVPKHFVVDWLSGGDVHQDASSPKLEKPHPCNEPTTAAAAVSSKRLEEKIAYEPKIPVDPCQNLQELKPDQPDLEVSQVPDSKVSFGRMNEPTEFQSLPEETLVHSQATIQLSKPLYGRDVREKLMEVLSTSLRIPPEQIKILGAEEGSSRICVVIQGDQSTCEGGMRSLALQLKDPSSLLLVSALGLYFS